MTLYSFDLRHISPTKYYDAFEHLPILEFESCPFSIFKFARINDDDPVTQVVYTPTSLPNQKFCNNSIAEC